jgi:hypothetical protein
MPVGAIVFMKTRPSGGDLECFTRVTSTDDERMRGAAYRHRIFLLRKHSDQLALSSLARESDTSETPPSIRRESCDVVTGGEISRYGVITHDGRRHADVDRP